MILNSESYPLRTCFYCFYVY